MQQQAFAEVGRAGWRPAMGDGVASGRPGGWNGEPQDQRWAELLATLRQAGGVVTPDDLAALMRPHHDQPVSLIARWLKQRTVLSVGWRGQTFIPLCQFDRQTMQPREDFLRVLHELIDAFDDWELLSWLAEPNAWLGGQAPALCLDADLARVLQAARADRFIAKG